jgi:hypothetical protein
MKTPLIEQIKELVSSILECAALQHAFLLAAITKTSRTSGLYGKHAYCTDFLEGNNIHN